jgi:hypothetical protein
MLGSSAVRRPEHPLVVALVESYAREIGVEPKEMWAALDGGPARPELVHGLVEAFFPLVRESDFGPGRLSRSDEHATLHTMHTTEFARPKGKRAKTGRPSRLKSHPLMIALEKAGVTVVDEAAAIRRSVSGLRSFCFARSDVSYRPVPRPIAERWLRVYDVPLSTWPRIAD